MFHQKLIILIVVLPNVQDNDWLSGPRLSVPPPSQRMSEIDSYLTLNTNAHIIIPTHVLYRHAIFRVKSYVIKSGEHVRESVKESYLITFILFPNR